MRHGEAERLETALRETLGIDEAETRAADAIVRELMRVRAFNPKAFQAALLLTMSTELVVGDAHVGTSAADLKVKLDRMVTLQTELGALVTEARQAMFAEAIREVLGEDLDEADVPIPSSKVN